MFSFLDAASQACTQTLWIWWSKRTPLMIHALWLFCNPCAHTASEHPSVQPLCRAPQQESTVFGQIPPQLGTVLWRCPGPCGSASQTYAWAPDNPYFSPKESMPPCPPPVPGTQLPKGRSWAVPGRSDGCFWGHHSCSSQCSCRSCGKFPVVLQPEGE